ncbi:mucin TcMUCII [Trypanosoma cruzi]|nr:mucin TcMUCII [Trypanosoma cruzi]
MTCRLLCALLVLALCCCCPSVCVSDSTEETIVVVLEDEEQGGGMSPPLPQPPTAKPDEAIVGAPSRPPRATGTPPVPGQSDPSKMGSVAKPGDDVGEGSGSTSTEDLGPNGVPNTLQADVNKDTTGPPSHKRLSEERANSESEDSTEETTTTTTTTTQAPSTTTTEAPTAMTTRAPSRLREMDGSLSSSAWVCAPLVLAASALAYTAVN